MNSFNSLHPFYLSTLKRVNEEYEYLSSPRGYTEREMLGFSAKIKHPVQRFCFHPERNQNIMFNYAEALWYLSGKNDLEFIRWYAPSMAKFSADGLTLPGTGYGKKLLHFGGQLNQIERAIDILKNDDPDSKRVFLQIFSAEEDLHKTNIDVSCTLGLQLMLRNNKLHMVAYMRANDAYVGLLSDIFSFTFLQEFMASLLGCEIGEYTHNVGSVHIYQNNQAKVDSILANPEAVFECNQSFPIMPTSRFSDVSDVLHYEQLIRQDRLSIKDVNQLPLHDYWRDILRLFKVNTFTRKGESVPDALLESIQPFHRSFLLNQFNTLNKRRGTAMTTNWLKKETSILFDQYDDYLEERLGYQPLIKDIKSSLGEQISVLDYGCGGGKVSRRLASSGIKKITGVDISPDMIARARGNDSYSGRLRFEQIESGKLPEDQTFDAAICCYVFINNDQQSTLHNIAAEIYGRLKPGGIFYLLDTNPDSTGIQFTSFMNGDPGVSYCNGERRPVYLKLPDGNVFKIIDTHWQKNTYEQVFNSAGFSSIQLFEHTDHQATQDANTQPPPPFILYKAIK